MAESTRPNAAILYPAQVAKDLAALGIMPGSLGIPENFYARESGIDHIRPAKTPDGKDVFVKIRVRSEQSGSYVVGGETRTYHAPAISRVGVYLPPDKAALAAALAQSSDDDTPPGSRRQDAILKGQKSEINRLGNEAEYTLIDGRSGRDGDFGDIAQIFVGKDGKEKYVLGFAGVHMTNLSADNLPFALTNMRKAAEASPKKGAAK